MILLLAPLAAILAVLLVLVTFVQLLYLESMRLLARELPALEHFKESIEQRIGLKTEHGALVFSLIKHSSLVFLGASFVGITLREHVPLWQALLEASLLSFLTMLLATYVVPQVLYRRTSGRWIVGLLPIVRALALIVQPIAAFLNFLHSLFEIGKPDGHGEQTPHASEHIEALITAGAEGGILEEEDRKLIHSVVAFGDKTVREVMTPRPNIVAIDCNKSLEDLRQLVIHEQYSRIPAFENSIDQIAGFVHVRDMFELDQSDRKGKRVRELMRSIRHVPETKPVNDLLREMQQDGAHMIVVVDEYGNTAGLATMEDLLEEILGEIRDEHEPTRDVTQEPDGAYLVSGSFDLDRLHDLLGFRPREKTESTTVGGLVTEWMGRVPTVGERIEREGIHIEVRAGNELRVEQVRISKAATT